VPVACKAEELPYLAALQASAIKHRDTKTTEMPLTQATL